MKASQTRKLDKIWSAKIRSLGRCERCGKTETLQAAHIFSRVYRSTRWDTNNGLCLCASCHFWGHRNPVEFTDFVRQIRGDAVEELLHKRNKVYKPVYEDILNELQD